MKKNIFFTKKLFTFVTLTIICSTLFTNNVFSQNKYQYEYVANDQYGARIYTLENGLKVYMSVYKEEPRIQAYVAVKVGGKHDPAETTGLAHYFEHMMFKGTSRFGTTDWETEKKYIDKIESLFEIYRLETDEKVRENLYKQIDSLSYIASGYAIPNEYDKMMKLIGSKGTNAATSLDYTYYVENIPSNQLENWAIIQAERFSDPILRLFHTELETVYEEKNMSLTNDGRKSFEVMLSKLFPTHPYGNQTVLGSPEHLRNPSMKNINAFFDTYYVPNNMAVIIAGDFNPDEAIVTIGKYFGKLKKKAIPEFTYQQESEITSPITAEVLGLDAENIMLGFRFNGANSDDALYISLISTILSNGKAGLIDLNVKQKQLALSASAYTYILGDYSALILSARPKSGQTLNDLKDLLLKQIHLLKKGEFPDWMLEAAVNNLKLQEMRRLESNSARTSLMMNAFLYDIPWEKQINSVERFNNISKKELLEFANKHLNDNYVVLYKKQAKPADIPTVQKPPITPVQLNRDVESDFVKSIRNNKVEKIEPVYIDFNSEIQRFNTQNQNEVLYLENTENDIFSLYYYFKIGTLNDPLLSLAVSYLPFLGSQTMTSEEIKQEFYRLACNFNVSTGEKETWISISGPNENFLEALKLAENILSNPIPNKQALDNLIKDILKSRSDNKVNQNANFAALSDYAIYGKKSPRKHFLSEKQLLKVKPEQLVEIIKNLNNYEHTVLYYGGKSAEELLEQINAYHIVTKKLTIPSSKDFKELETNKNKVYYAHYDANQSRLRQVIKSELFDVSLLPAVQLFNSYFGGSMNAIVFQEMREKRSLAYSANSTFATPSTYDKSFINYSFIATQNDKVEDSFDAFNELFDEMPISLKAFDFAKESILNRIETERIVKMNIIWTYLANARLGIDNDYRKDIYKAVAAMTIDDVVNFNQKYLKNKSKTYIVLGRESDIDFKALKKYGKVKKLSQKMIFGY